MDAKKQTAVEFLVESLTELGVDLLSHNLEIQQAKQMEKEQMKESVLAQSTKHEGLRKIFENQFEKYYNETYGN